MKFPKQGEVWIQITGDMKGAKHKVTSAPVTSSCEDEVTTWSLTQDPEGWGRSWLGSVENFQNSFRPL